MNVFTEIKARVSCVDVAKEYGIHLTKKGNHFLALCPFHAEKTPSFIIHPDHFYCFGCGAGGDTIRLVEMLRSMQPYEAAQEIVQQFSLPIQIDQDKPLKPMRKKRYSQTDFLRSLEAWRDETFPVYALWFKAIGEVLQGMTMDMPYFHALTELRADLDYVTEKQISDDFTEVLKAYRHTKGTILDITQEAVGLC